MKKYLFAMIALAGALALAGCDKENGENKEPLPDPEITNETEIKDIPFTGGTFTYEFDANRSWKISATDVIGADAYEVEIAPVSGEAGHSSIEIKLPANRIQNEITFSFTLTLLGENQTSEDAYTKEFQLTVPAPSVTDAAGNTYKVVYLKDGNYWMAENLRYIPEGKTVSDDATKPTEGIYYPVNKTDKKLDKELVATYGLLYQPSAAFGVELNKDNYKEVEGCQGVCPKGWHIPTAKEYIALVGRINKNETLGYDVDVKAPYYDATTKWGSTAKLNEDGFNIDQSSGYLNASNSSAKSLTILSTMGWILGSSWHIGFNAKGEQASPTFGADGSLTKVQYYSLMIYYNNMNNNVGTINSHLCAVPVRCVMDKAAE